MERQHLQESRQNSELAAPYVTAIRKEAKNKIPGHERSLDIVFDEINRQAIESFQINNSEKFPGISFSSVHLSVAPELIKKINPQINMAQESGLTNGSEDKPKHYAYFLQPAFGAGGGGNPYSVLDLGIDRFIREMPRIMGALRRGERPPVIDIYLVGAPQAFGGKVTPEWVEDVKKRGFEPHGELYAEFMQKQLSTDTKEFEKTRIIMQGVSKGASTSVATSRNLQEDLKKKTQRLYDVPIGIHQRNLLSKIVKGANMLSGMAGEMAARTIGAKIGTDIASKSLSQTEPQFYKDMASKFDLKPDDAEQRRLKASCLVPEVLALIRGNPIDKSERTFIRKPEIDPSNLDLGNLRRILLNDLRLFWRKKIIASGGVGRISNFPTSRKLHFFVYKKDFKRWAQIMEHAESNL
ncbi:MAG: hypothetical protein HY425_00685 [Candidatus Levybacteria bacterium]|nr:hypothetical protein [Candidatus Levybacteria bacterium]